VPAKGTMGRAGRQPLAWAVPLLFALAGATGGPASAAQDRPSAELVEFLGRFTTDDGHWVDPLALRSPRPGEAARLERATAPKLSKTDRVGHDDYE